MEALCGLFDAVACVGELLGRGGEKEEELSALVGIVGSVSQSVRAFAQGLDDDERRTVFNENPVFPQLAKHLQECNGVIAKYRGTNDVDRLQLEDKKDVQESRPILATLKKGLMKSSKTLHEGLEVFGGKLGSIGAGILRLPEDELAIIRQSSQELQRLVPTLNLAISVYTLRGHKRRASAVWTHFDPPPQVPRLQAPAADVAAGTGASDQKESVPLLRLQLVSDYKAARTCELPALTSQELRPISNVSSSSVDSTMGTNSDGAVRLVFGRQELRDKIPKTFTLPTKTGEAPQPLGRFISRDLFLIDVPREPPQQDTMDMATLNFGSAGDDYGATLAWGSEVTQPSQPPAEARPLATVSGLSSSGLHLREAGQTSWRWVAKERRVDMRHGDRIALLLESPPGSCIPGPPRDLSAEEAQCLMGLEVQQP